MDEKLQAKWVKALRSGKYKQGKGILRSADNKFCCLGVLLDVVNRKAWPKKPEPLDTVICGKERKIEGYFTEDNGNALLMGTLDEIGLTLNEQNDLVDMNDSGKRFRTIADWIEKNL